MAGASSRVCARLSVHVRARLRAAQVIRQLGLAAAGEEDKLIEKVVDRCRGKEKGELGCEACMRAHAYVRGEAGDWGGGSSSGGGGDGVGWEAAARVRREARGGSGWGGSLRGKEREG